MTMTLNMNRTRQNENMHGSPDTTLFGYFFSSDEPAPAPEAPAQGIPLLTDFELDSSHQFFDRFQNDQFADEAKLFDHLGAAFQHEPIPNLHSVGSSLGQPHIQGADAGLALNFGHFEHDLNARFDQANLSSPHTDHFPPSNALHFHPGAYNSYDARRPAHSRHHSDAFSTHNAFDAHSTTAARSDFSRQSAPTLSQGSLVFGGDPSFATSAANPSAPQRIPSAANEGGNAVSKTIAPALGFGSDQGFRNQNYIPPRRTQEEVKSAEQTVHDNMSIFEAHKHDSTDNTAPSSPVMTKSKRRLSDIATELPKVVTGSAMNGKNHGSHAQVGDKRQRKVKVEADEDEDNDDVAVMGKTRVARKGKSSGHKARTLSEGAAGHGVRRKSNTGDKSQRQNLTEEEKKQNHIKSEQKRRNQIKDGFANLITLMPDGAPAGTSKCAILSQAVDWLAGLIEGNEQLRAQLKQLGG